METPTVNAHCPTDEPVLVRHGIYECLGYRDEQGKWHEWYSDKEIHNVTGWTPLE